jgi:hypothetical protein
MTITNYLPTIAFGKNVPTMSNTMAAPSNIINNFQADL